MFLKIADLKLVKIQVKKDGECIYEGLVEEAPQEIKELHYKTAEFESNHINIEV